MVKTSEIGQQILLQLQTQKSCRFQMMIRVKRILLHQSCLRQRLIRNSNERGRRSCSKIFSFFQLREKQKTKKTKKQKTKKQKNKKTEKQKNKKQNTLLTILTLTKNHALRSFLFFNSQLRDAYNNFFLAAYNILVH